MSAPAIEFREVWKSYRRYAHGIRTLKGFLLSPWRRAAADAGSVRPTMVLEGLSFHVEQGECLGIIGRNGSGKSTLLGLAAGVLRPTRGAVIIRERPCPMLELGAGFHPDFTGRENIVLNGVMLGRPRRFMRAKEDEIAAFAELEDYIDEPVRTYSSGMLARLGFAVLAHIEPRLLLIDEILAVGDLAFQEKCLEKIAEFRSKGVTMVLVSHNLADVRAVCDRVLWIGDQGVLLAGRADEVTAAYAESLVESAPGPVGHLSPNLWDPAAQRRRPSGAPR